MSLIQQIQDGKALGATTGASDSSGKATTASKMNETKEMFLQLLVTEMQYQDPMQPSDNSEYVKELAQFTQVESLNAMQDDIAKMNANALPGKYVTLTDSETGKDIEGLVEYVKSEGSKNYVSVDGNLYDVADIQTVSDTSYYEDQTMASNVEQLINSLPDLDKLTLKDAEKVEQVATAADGLSQKAYSYLSRDAIARMTSIIEKLNTITEAAAKFEEAEKAKNLETEKIDVE